MRSRLLHLGAGVALLAASAAAAQPFHETKVIFASDGKEAKINAYPTVAALPDGRLFLAFTQRGPTEFTARIAGSFSSDNGSTWSPAETILDTPLGDYDPTVVLTRDEIQVYSTSVPVPVKLIHNSEMWKTTRKFNGSSWSKPVRLPSHHVYECGRIHIGLSLKDGTLLMPYSWDVPAQEGKPSATEGGMKLKAGVLRSRDGGATWAPGGDMFVETPKKTTFSTAGVDEPALVQLKDGALYTLLRTSDVWLYESRSRDGGITWETPAPSKLAGHNTPAALWKLRSGEIVVVWNNSPANRWPLDVALSTDNAKTWSAPRTLANQPGQQSSYPTATQAKDGTIIAIWQQDLPDRKGRDLHVARFNREWLSGR